MTEYVHFQEEARLRRRIESCYQKERTTLRSFLPYADIRHVGSTAVPGLLTKGDLDIQVRVNEKDFQPAKKILLALYDTDEDSPSTEYFISFKDDRKNPPLSIRLTVMDHEFDIFWRITDELKENEMVRKAYNDLKKRFEGAKTDEYRKAKSMFLDKLVQTEIFHMKVR